MKYLIFSDTHFTQKFDPAKFAIFKDAIEQADKVIINGDFWEGFGISFDSFVTSKWKDTLFPLLKKKKAVYLFGNHDRKNIADERMSLFSDSQEVCYTFKSGEKTFHVEHGDKGVALPNISVITLTILTTIEEVVIRLLGDMFVKPVYGIMNRKLKSEIRGKYKENEYLVTGHTHCAEINLKAHYINSGFSKYGRCQYIFIEDGVVTAVTKTY